MPTSPRSWRPAAARRLLLVLVLALAVAGCGVALPDSEHESGSESGFDPAGTELHVAFRDSSVPPRYHRSYDITVQDRKAHVVVDSYGTVIHDVTVAIPDSVWTSFVRSLDADVAAIGEPEVVDTGCAGGTALAVEVTSGDTTFEREVENCGSKHNKVVVGQLEALLAPVRAAIDLDALTATD